MNTPTSSAFIAGLICFARERAGLTITEVSAALDISYQNLWAIENGYKNVSPAYLDLIIEKLNMTPLEFWGLVPQYMRQLKKAELKINGQKIN